MPPELLHEDRAVEEMPGWTGRRYWLAGNPMDPCHYIYITAEREKFEPEMDAGAMKWLLTPKGKRDAA